MAEQENSIYVGCALTQAPPEFRQGVEQVKDSLKDRGHNIRDFLGLEAGTAGDVYDWDIVECVGKCSVMLAIVDYPSIGLGWEMSTARNLATPTLAVAQTDSSVTRLLIGAAERNQSVEFERYQDLEEVPDKLEAFTDRHSDTITNLNRRTEVMIEYGQNHLDRLNRSRRDLSEQTLDRLGGHYQLPAVQQFGSDLAASTNGDQPDRPLLADFIETDTNKQATILNPDQLSLYQQEDHPDRVTQILPETRIQIEAAMLHIQKEGLAEVHHQLVHDKLIYQDDNQHLYSAAMLDYWDLDLSIRRDISATISFINQLRLSLEQRPGFGV